MESARMAGALALALAFVNQSLAQSATTPRDDTIKVSEVEVRSGPSPVFYATSKLHQGDRVRVLGEENGWLAIEPPMPDSFSWIDTRNVDQVGSTAIVSVPEAPLRVGSRLLDQPPTVQRARVQKGTQLVVIGKAEVAPDGKWLPVLPAPREARYVPASALAGVTSSPQIAPNMVATVPPKYTEPAPAAPVAAAGGVNAKWREAEAAERNGDVISAIRLYEELAHQVSISDHDLAMRSLNRSQYLRNRQTGLVSTAQAPQTGPTATYYSNGNAENRSIAPAGNAAAQIGPYYTASQQRPAASQYCYVKDPCAIPTSTVTLAAPSTAMSAIPAQPQSPGAATPAQWHGPGRLYKAPFFLAGQQAYGLELANGQSRIYLTAGPGLSLDSYLERNVQLYGAAVYHGELRTSYMTALQIHPVAAQ